MNRRIFSLSALAAPFAAAFGSKSATAAEGPFEVTRTDAEWRAMLTNAQYRVMRQEGTERAGSSPLDKNYAAGVYHRRGCDQALYASEHKYDSGTGWPSFFDVLPSAIETKEDNSLFSMRTECHCDRCGSHLGHIHLLGRSRTNRQAPLFERRVAGVSRRLSVFCTTAARPCGDAQGIPLPDTLRRGIFHVTTQTQRYRNSHWPDRDAVCHCIGGLWRYARSGQHMDQSDWHHLSCWAKRVGGRADFWRLVWIAGAMRVGRARLGGCFADLFGRGHRGNIRCSFAWHHDRSVRVI